MQNCFGVIGKVSERIILVDDVITTGATVNECAKILRTAGAKEIWVVVCAKG
jgi:predicted amidophosphoribosyltransferase